MGKTTAIPLMVDGSFPQLSILDSCNDHGYDLRLFHHPHQAQTLLLTHLLCFFFCHVSEQAICYQRWILFVFFDFLNGISSWHGDGNARNESKGYGTLQRKQHAQSRAQQRSYHIIVGSTYVNWNIFI